MQEVKEKLRRIRTVQKIFRNQQEMSNSRHHKINSNGVNKTTSHKTISYHSHLQTNSKEKQRHIRSQTSTGYRNKIQNPYDKFVKEMAIVLPSPKDKFYQFIEISPFNRNSHHLQLIQHFLRQYKFFRNHPVQLMLQFAKKVKIQSKKNLTPKQLVIIQSGESLYQKQRFLKGDIIGRYQLATESIICSPQTKFFTINRHEYQFLINSYLEKEKLKFQTFLSNVQIFKMFPKKVFNKFMQTLTLQFLNAGEHLYHFGDSVNQLFIVFSGKASRKVIVEIDKVNKIPLLKYTKIVKILSKSYQHKIQFHTEDLIGISEVVDHIQSRKQNIKIQQNSIILGLDKNIFQQNLDQYIIDRLKKQNMKKYPVTYDKLCQKFQKDKISLKREQMRKIQALRNTINSSLSEKKSQKINLIIKKYQENIKKSELKNLLNCKVQQRNVQRE